MRKFITKTIILSLVAIVIAAFPLMYRKIDSDKIKFTINKNKNILILGDSHAECAVNDSVLCNAANYAQSGEAYIYSYVKIKRFVRDNPQINTVLLGFSFHNISEKYDYWYKRSDFVSEKMRRYFMFMNFSEIKEIATINPKSFYQSISGKNYRWTFLEDNLTILDFGLGGYANLHREKLKEAIAEKKSQPIEKVALSTLQLKYLQKIISFCEEKRLKLIFLGTPLYEDGSLYYMKDWFYDHYNKHYKQVRFLDYSEMKFPDSCYGDVDHLNYRGALTFSVFLDSVLNRVH